MIEISFLSSRRNTPRKINIENEARRIRSKHNLSLETTPPPRKWEDVRFILENTLALTTTYLEGMCIDSWEDLSQYQTQWIPLKEGRKVLPREYDSNTIYQRILLKRIQIPPPLSAWIPDAWIPKIPKSSTQEEEKTDGKDQMCEIEGTNEEERLGNFFLQMQQTNDHLLTSYKEEEAEKKNVSVPRKQSQQHPSKYKVGDFGAKPHSNYVCKGCSAIGDHFRSMCSPSLMVNKRLHSTKIEFELKQPHGIPKSFLQTISKHSAYTEKSYLNNVFIGEDDETALVYRKRQRKGREFHEDDAGDEDVVDSPSSSNKDLRRKRRKTANLSGSSLFDIDAYFQSLDQREDDEERAFYEANPKYKKKKNIICKKYLVGLCQKGYLECMFAHRIDIEEASMPTCQFFLKGTCSRGIQCEFRHEHLRGQAIGDCPYYDAGFCPEGTFCKFGIHSMRPMSDHPFLKQRMIEDAKQKASQQKRTSRNLVWSSSSI